MDEAYAKASDDGRLPVRPRQIMYAARPDILEITGKDYLDERYFTQTLLPDYLTINPEETRSWDIVWDARGHFTEPHTGTTFGLGTLEVREYLGLRAARGDAVMVNRDVLYLTSGPEHRFSTILFVEKEGFDPLFATEHLAERYDLAIMSTKGMSVTVSRLLLDRLTNRGIRQIFVLHDFDISGFSIFGTLGTSNRRYGYQNKVPLIDIGLRLEDVEVLDLQSEPVAVGGWEKRTATLRRHGATKAEIDFLKDERVELNAMTSPQLITFIEGKLAEHGVEKLVPAEATLKEHARRLVEQQLAAAAVEKLKAKLQKDAAKRALPADLSARVQTLLKVCPELPWDAALAELLGAD